jgi:hypothetical protein
MLHAEGASLGCLTGLAPQEVLCIKATSSPSLHLHPFILAWHGLPRADWRCRKCDVTERAGCCAQSADTHRPWRAGPGALLREGNNRDGINTPPKPTMDCGAGSGQSGVFETAWYAGEGGKGTRTGPHDPCSLAGRRHQLHIDWSVSRDSCPYNFLRALSGIITASRHASRRAYMRTIS